jgi:uncharacterized protein YecE (DUF72 family)
MAGAARRARGQLLVGTSGYVYDHWRGLFYPPGLPQRRWLSYYAERFPTVELNNPFYRLPAAATFEAWRRAVPPGFVFAVKASRFITHMKRLKDAARHLGLFLRRARRLGPALGPVLFQLPERFHADVERLDGFLAALGSQRLVPGLRAALEVRHASWLDAAVLERLSRAGVALCLHDSVALRVDGPVTADFVYVRRHGAGARGGYSRQALRADAERIAGWLAENRDVYVYFNNDARAFAVADALTLGRLLARRGAARRPGAGRSRPRRSAPGRRTRSGPRAPAPHAARASGGRRRGR